MVSLATYTPEIKEREIRVIFKWIPPRNESLINSPYLKVLHYTVLRRVLCRCGLLELDLIHLPLLHLDGLRARLYVRTDVMAYFSSEAALSFRVRRSLGVQDALLRSCAYPKLLCPWLPAHHLKYGIPIFFLVKLLFVLLFRCVPHFLLMLVGILISSIVGRSVRVSQWFVCVLTIFRVVFFGADFLGLVCILLCVFPRRLSLDSWFFPVPKICAVSRHQSGALWSDVASTTHTSRSAAMGDSAVF